MTPPAFWRPQGRRQLAVVSLYLGYLAGLVCCSFTSRESIPSSVGIGLMLVSGLVALFGLAGVVQSRRTLFLGSGGLLDERQQAVRNRAYYAAYQALGLIAISCAVYLSLFYPDRVSPMLNRSAVILLGAGVILLVMTLPSAMMAWTEPDPPEDSGAYNMVNRRSP